MMSARASALQASPEDEPLRISLGVSTAARSEDLPAALRLADEKMYQEKEAKKKG